MHGAEPIIRPLRATDRAGWAPLWESYLTFYESSLPADVTDSSFARLSDPAATERGAFVAKVEGALVGFVHYIFHAHNWKPEGVCYLQDLYVSEAARGQGVARALIHAVYDAARAAGSPSVYWLTAEDNHAARALYDTLAQTTPFIKYQGQSA